jgi:predicted dehydrogenase
MKDSIAVGVAGLGFGANHARVLSELPHARLAAICDGDGERLAAAVPGRNVARYADVDTMLAGERLDALMIALPASRHAQAALRAIEAGCAVLIEKPMATTRAEGESLAATARDAGVPIMAGHIERFNPALIELRHRVRAGEIGRVVQITARRMGAIRHPPRDVNVIHDSAIHDIDAMRWLLGAEVTQVYASARSSLNMPVEDSVTAILQFEGAGSQPGPMASLEVSWLSARRVRDLAVVGETGMFVLRYASQSLEHYKTPPRSGPLQGWALASTPEEGAAVVVPVEAREQLVLELEAFVEAVRTGSAMPVTVDDGLAALAVADALTLSARTGQPASPGSIES